MGFVMEVFNLLGPQVVFANIMGALAVTAALAFPARNAIAKALNRKVTEHSYALEGEIVARKRKIAAMPSRLMALDARDLYGKIAHSVYQATQGVLANETRFGASLLLGTRRTRRIAMKAARKATGMSRSDLLVPDNRRRMLDGAGLSPHRPTLNRPGRQ
ncbi:hypothetical protein [Nocardiopsis potens]|uniref:hypothetical protein n=1 Tax=Nocardiopsis potens TaxID=1246458 RepID=UPI00034669D0|nr:hypothetical protein [Nocardiopsis potens]